MSSKPTILVVDDERQLTDLYATWVDEDYDVLTAYDGRSALEQMSAAVDVVLLDRHMPDLNGDEVLERIRAAGHDCWVIMVTAVDPGLDIVELDIDDYVTKPVSRAQLTRIIENLRVQSRYAGDGRRELAALSNKMETLEDEAPLENVEESAAYQELEDDLTELSDSLVDAEPAPHRPR
ncbi:response regulator [Natronolimnohabitans innermongolicus]|uniref:Response regulator receiver protein n=1 Tax=Natronolimnohabitans innermongolicus JCM 12255 TaxID=1227499 RepID=L9X7D2_9EURY|nr:response regulator [Natronolimnohabitans innermongolicus]ELY57630.1 response regulator receiver protein [Natronolimnohabitans innermongolicus JCM 12255]